jgi:hypothetical protein
MQANGQSNQVLLAEIQTNRRTARQPCLPANSQNLNLFLGDYQTIFRARVRR